MTLEEIIQNKQPDERCIYTQIDGLNLPMHLYFPKVHNTEELKPAVVLIHGGAWGGRKDNSDWNGDYMNASARYFAMRGAVGINFSYRNVYNPRQEEKLFENGPELIDLYADCLAALRYIRSNYKKIGVDVDKIAVIGDSAGGHLASCPGTLDILRGSDDIKPAFVVACNPITDLTDPKWFCYVGAKTRHSEFEGMSREEMAKLVSPIYNITPSSSPMLVIHGTEDTVVSPSHSTKFYEELVKAGVECRLSLIEGAGHAFVLPEYYPDKKTVLKAIDIIDDYFCENKILLTRTGGIFDEYQQP